MKNLSWKERFNIPTDSEHSVADVLRAGLINEDEYLEWASEAYELPVLDAAFFKSVSEARLLSEYASDLWTNSFYPVAIWDEALYIACLEPQDVDVNIPCHFLLSPLKPMELTWEIMAKTFVEKTMTVDTSSSIKVPDFKEEPAPLLDFSIPVIAPETPVRVPPAPTPQTPTTSTPLPPIQKHEPVSFTQRSENSFAKSQITALFEMDEKSKVLSIPDFVIEELLKPETTKTSTQVHANPHAKPENFERPEITNVVTIGQKAEFTFTNTKTIMPFPERSTHFSFIRTVFSEQIILEARNKVKENTDPHQALISAFCVLKDYYKKLMWAVRDQKGNVYPIASNSAWDFSEEAWNTPIDFKTPNPFRIAKFTAKPYHGEVYPNPVNDHFFQQWNSGKYPNVLTIVPVKLQGKVFAYFVGCEPSIHFHPTNSLDVMQATCDELIQTFVTIHKELSANNKAAAS